jgi:cytochrome b subunit of formate dehydrogenase
MEGAVKSNNSDRYYFRFTLGQRYLHGLMMATFLGLAATGMALRFSDRDWAKWMAESAGGFTAVLSLHKLCAVLISAAFLYHVGEILFRAIIKKERGLFWGPNSMIPQPRDIVDLYKQARWFLWMGPQPEFDHFTYWEKFDYWAVFWGMAIIGISGYMMWFGPFFARFVPGYVLNIALLIHGEEALLAVWFIFIIHFFNSHLRPEKFPLDPVIFTGRVTAGEYQHERSLDYSRLDKSGGLESLRTDPPPLWLKNFSRLIAIVTVGIGFFLLFLTLIAFWTE